MPTPNLLIDPVLEGRLSPLYRYLHSHAYDVATYLYFNATSGAVHVPVNELNLIMSDLEQYILSGRRGPWVPKYLPQQVSLTNEALKRADHINLSGQTLSLFDQHRPRALYTLMYLTEKELLNQYLADNGSPVALNKPKNSGDSDATSIT